MSLKEKKGWKDYMDYKAVRDYRLYELGIEQGLGQAASPNMNISADIVADFDAWKESQSKENPEWYNSYKTGGAENTYLIAVKAGRLLLQDQEWMDDQPESSWANQLKEYIDYRDVTAYNLARATNEDQKDFYKLDLQQKVNALKLENTTWAYYYDRFFDGDNLEVIK
jgi:hypothetical protein